MTHKERAVAALNLQVPDMVPTFELEFQLAEELLGKPVPTPRMLEGIGGREYDRLLHEIVETTLQVTEILDYSIVNAHFLGGHEGVRLFRRLTGDKYLVWAHGDGTFSIPDGDHMLEMSYRIVDDPEGMHEEARRMVNDAIERSKRWMDAGVDCFGLCADYCFNSGPFFSPRQFSEFVTPYLGELVNAQRAMGAYIIKHTDGNIMPIIEDLVQCKPHALHSLDPMAGVDIAVVKRLYGDKVCLIGNVNCALLQTGTREEIIANAEYSLKHGKPNGGYIFSTSNVAFKGMPLENYMLIQEVWKNGRTYN